MDQPTTHTGGGHGSAPGRSPVVFVSDASVEAVRIADTLRAAGYVVADVPMSLLAARVGAQRPDVVLVDVDADGVLEGLATLRKMPGTGAIDFVFLGSGDGRVKNADDALANDGSAFFARPVDVGGLVRKIEALTGGPAARPEVRPSTPPPSIPVSRSMPSRDVPASSERPSVPSLPSPGLRTPGPPLPMSSPSLAELVDPPRSLATFGTVSNELQQLLAEAELRAEVLSTADAPVPSPEEEIEAVLPADVLASLDEPLDGDDDDEAHDRPGTGAGADGTGPHAKITTSAGTRPPTTGSGRPATGAHTHERRVTSDPPPPRSAVPATTPGGRRTTDVPNASPAPPPVSQAPPLVSSQPPAEALRAPTVQAAPPAPSGAVLGPGDARRFVGDAVARRATGALCFEHDGVVRRLVVRDGDLATAASSSERESLVQFLGARGELPREAIESLTAKIPPYGRHAGAALVAHGWLGQDQLWSVLRAHAEWIASTVLRLPAGVAQLEVDPPGRLRSEPSVFGASTGAEIFVELVRRAVVADEALERLGGHASRIADGPNQGLLAECNLAPQELELLSRARGGTLADLLARAPDVEIVVVVHALALLGALEIVQAPDFARAGGRLESADDGAALDEEALRARVRARLELVEDGDYFAVLGVPRDATGYEVRRAFLELRRAFEPSRILRPSVVDLADDVRKIVSVLEEAYEILRDGARRERYLRAIEARPD